MAPHRNHVEARSSRRPARQYVAESHEHKPDAPLPNEPPDFYACIRFEFDEIILALNEMQNAAKLMRSNFDGEHDVALKLSLEQFATKAEQARVMSNHLAGVLIRRINRRPRP